MENSVKIENLNFSYNDGERILKDINLEIKNEDFIIIIGGNGSGKSTLIKNILGELKPDTGTVHVLGKDIQTYKSYREIGYVPQISVVDKIAFPITVSEMVVLNLYEDMGTIKIARKEHKEKVDKILNYMDLTKYKDYPVNELSGGLQQRAMIARAMINEPKLIILDEPTAGVDKSNREEFLKSIDKLNSNDGLTVIMVTHELEEVLDHIDVDAIYEIVEGELYKKEVERC